MLDNQILNLLLHKAINQTLDAGIKCGKIVPEIKINNRASYFLGRCSALTEYKGETVYVIEVSRRALELDEREIMDTLCHEVLHSCKGCMNHGAQWKKYAEIMNRKYGYDIKRCADTEKSGLKKEKRELQKNYCLQCVKCGEKHYFARYSKRVRNPQNCVCGYCGGELKRIF